MFIGEGMSTYANLFDVFWKTLDASLVLLGIWCFFQPSFLLGLPGSMVFTQELGDKLGLSREVSAHLLSSIQFRQDQGYGTIFLRAVGVAFVLGGLVGIFSSLNEATIFSVLMVVVVALLTLTFLSPRRIASKRASMLTRLKRVIMPAWLLLVLLAEAFAEHLVGTDSAEVTSLATALCVVFISLLSLQPVVLSGEAIELEGEIDRRIRIGHIITLAIFSELPSMVWSVGPNSVILTASIARIAVSLSFLCVVAYAVDSARRSDADLLQTINCILP